MTSAKLTNKILLDIDKGFCDLARLDRFLKSIKLKAETDDTRQLEFLTWGSRPDKRIVDWCAVNDVVSGFIPITNASLFTACETCDSLICLLSGVSGSRRDWVSELIRVCEDSGTHLVVVVDNEDI